ncbi:right-handed parallel beta-helix repeat-containing protein [Aquisphaera insulae]|uniref:right-handed parallel beta-helix repeat-containing protein n=1 Tax=Aquisphaera insulae TaxID=2712864 RepID=UPI0013ECAE9A|nr:right-handed parallel beta-helix repeat-containing protein [Aquisphaera insulae]
MTMSLLKLMTARRDSARRNVARRHLGMESLEGRQVLSSFTVSSIADAGAGSLRAAIIAADSASDAATINFAITGSNKNVVLQSALPELSNVHGITFNGQSGVTIDLAKAKLSSGNSIRVDSLSTVTIRNLEFKNSPGRAFENNGTLTLSGVTVSGSTNGAAVNYGTMTVTGSTIKNNAAYNYGGGVNNYSGTLNIVNSTFSGNSTKYGGAVYNNARMTISGSTFRNNTAIGGGAIWDNSTVASAISSSTITANTAQYGGGYALDSTFAATLTGNDIYANTATTAPDIMGKVGPASSNNVIGTGSGMTGIADNNAFARNDNLAHPKYNSAKPVNYVGTGSTRISPVMTQQVSLDGVTASYSYTVRTNSATMTLTGRATQPVSLGSLDGDNSDGPIVYPNQFATTLFLTDTQNGASGSISLWQNYDATSLSAPTLTITNRATGVTDAIQDQTHTWVDTLTGVTTVYTWTNGKLTKTTR